MKKNILFAMILPVTMLASNFINQQNPGTIETGENIAVVSTQHGDIRGYIDDGIYAFKGIPYAKAERFMPPQAPDEWEGVIQTTINGPKAMQGSGNYQRWGGQGDYPFGFQNISESMDEKESFVLNVWTKGINDGLKRPVWLYIHGGGYSSGSSNAHSFFDGRSMAEKGDIVVVTVNHRLNVLGYLDLTGLGGKYSESVNLGMQDLVASLQWIQDNIASFGGDTGIVTIDGQSGGGGKVATLMAMPSAAGLFHRAIAQSGSTLSIGNSEDSKAYGLAFVEALGITPDEADKLNDFTYKELVQASRRAPEILNESGQPTRRRRVGPTVDGRYVVQHPFDPAPSEFSKDVPMLIGCNLNESGNQRRAIITPQTMDQVRGTLTERFGVENAEKYIEAYKEAYPDDDQPQHILTTSLRRRNSALKQATIKNAQGGAPAYVYLFEWQSPVNDGSLGACHGMELPFMFNNIAMARYLTGGGEDAYVLADKISSAWISFIKTGNPNCDALPEWDHYTPEKGTTMIFDNTCKALDNHDKDLIEFENLIPADR
jgi:para-nitrobenzyl esterase